METQETVSPISTQSSYSSKDVFNLFVLLKAGLMKAVLIKLLLNYTRLSSYLIFSFFSLNYGLNIILHM